MSTGFTRARKLLWLVGAAGAVGIIFLLWFNGRLSPWSAPETAFPLPPYSKSPFLNTGPDAQYVGIAACAECHPANHQSYLLTAHSRALADVDPQTEPPDGSFQHQLSGCSYRVYRQDGQLRHEEVLRTAEGKEISRVDLPVRYLVGSGNFSRTYLVEVDGFLHESPITWYASKKQWGMSPGYDDSNHWSFGRPIRVACLACHAGRLEPSSTTQHVTLHEKAIGCENCHGPGSRHVALQKASPRKGGRVERPGTEDLTIVNPRKLTRPLQEAICASCHFSAAATVHLRGRQVTSFRPGMPLSDYRIDYRFDTGSDQMTVVGHMEQLRQSDCYQQSADLTCLTCHDPHARERPKDPTAYYRQKCLNCHTIQACKLGPAQRLKKDATDNCVACHMPRGDTDIPHIAFTHHRIGRHEPKPPSASRRVPNLVPVADVSHLAPLERQRNLGLAYMEASRNPLCLPYVDTFCERARDLLEEVHAAGLRDAEMAAALATLNMSRNHVRGRAFAREALAAKDVSAEVRGDALCVLAMCEAKDKNFQAATAIAKELVRVRRGPEDWCILGTCYQMQDQPREALAALQYALTIRPDRHVIHLWLALIYRQQGDTQRAKEHQEKGQWLFDHRPQ